VCYSALHCAVCCTNRQAALMTIFSGKEPYFIGSVSPKKKKKKDTGSVSPRFCRRFCQFLSSCSWSLHPPLRIPSSYSPLDLRYALFHVRDRKKNQRSRSHVSKPAITAAANVDDTGSCGETALFCRLLRRRIAEHKAIACRSDRAPFSR